MSEASGLRCATSAPTEAGTERRSGLLGWGVGGVLLVALILRLIGITGTDVWADEATTILLTRASWSDLLMRLPTATDHPPLTFLLFKAWSLLFHSEWGVRLLPVVFGMGAVGTLMAVAHRVDPRAMIPTGLLAAVSPVPVHFSQEIRGYSLLFFLTTTALWATQRVREQPASGRRVALLALLAALPAHVHPVGLFVFPMCLVYLLATIGWGSIRTMMRPVGGWLWLLLIGPVVWMCLRQSGEHQEGWWIPQVSFRQLRFYYEEYLGLNIAELWQGAHVPRPFWTGFIFERLLMLGPAVLVVVALLDPRRRRLFMAWAGAAATYVGVMALSSLLFVPNMLVRTLLPGWAPVLVLMGVGGAAGATRRGRVVARTGLAMVVGLHAVGWVWWVEAGPPRRPPARDSYQWLRQRLGPQDVVVSASPGFQEISAYYLGDVVPNERLLGSSVPLLAGSPPARKMIPTPEDPNWPARLRAALATADRDSGGRYNVWCIGFGLPVPPMPGNVPDVLAERHRLAEEYVREDVRGITVSRYVPCSVATRTGP